MTVSFVRGHEGIAHNRSSHNSSFNEGLRRGCIALHMLHKAQFEGHLRPINVSHLVLARARKAENALPFGRLVL